MADNSEKKIVCFSDTPQQFALAAVSINLECAELMVQTLAIAMPTLKKHYCENCMDRWMRSWVALVERLKIKERELQEQTIAHARGIMEGVFSDPEVTKEMLAEDMLDSVDPSKMTKQ